VAAGAAVEFADAADYISVCEGGDDGMDGDGGQGFAETLYRV